MQLQAGATVDRYVVEGLLGSGGMAEVYAVHHATLGTPAALKVLRVRSPQLASRLIREGKAQSKLQHPNVVRVLDLLDVGGAPALVMDRVEGLTLAQVIADGPPALARTERLIRGMMLGLHAAHTIGVIHRDLKPSNILIAAGDVPRIADFGLATAMLDESDAGLTRPGTAIGTPAYMAPEQHEDAHTVDVRADVFALGVVMYEMIAGFAPAAGGNFLVAWQKMTNKRWRPLSEVVPGLPERIDRAVCWALEPDRDARAPSVAALWERCFEEPFPQGGIDPRETPVGTPHTLVPERSELALAWPAPFPAPSELSAIPRVNRALFGRDREWSAVCALLDLKGTLVTLTGTAGVGKTRLAIAVAEAWREERKPAIWVDLQAARDEHDLVRTLAWSLEGELKPTGSVAHRGGVNAASIGRTLARRGALLLVLDNFEQLPREAALLVDRWLAMCPSLRVLATSRQPLEIDTEQIIEVAPLPLPTDSIDVLRSPAWELFAAAAPPGTLEHVDLNKIVALFSALDGLPLALELAAARLEVLDIDDLVRRLADRFALLSTPGASHTDSAHDRHGALFNAIEWSWSLLREAEQRALAQLSCFVSPFSLETAEAVLDAGDNALDLLHGLVRRSLIRKNGPRFSMLLSVRAFAALMLARMDSESHATERRHAAWFCARALHCQQPDVMGTEQALSELAEAVDECGVVLERVARRRETAEISLIEDALGCALGCTVVFAQRGPAESTLRTVELALSLHSSEADSALAIHRRLELRARRAYAWRVTGQVERARVELTSVIAQATGPELLAIALANLADITVDLEEAFSLYTRSLSLSRIHGPAPLTVTSSGAIAQICAQQGRFDEAEQWIADALGGLSPDDDYAAIELYKAKGYVALVRDDLDAARSAYRNVRERAIRRRARRTELYATGQLGLIADAADDLDRAMALLEEAQHGLTLEGDSVLSSIYRGYRARVLAKLGRTEEAEAEIASVLEEQDIDPWLRETFMLFASLAVVKERPASALSWIAATGEQRHPHEPLVSSLVRGFSAIVNGDRAEAASASAEARVQVEQIDDLPTRALASMRVEELSALSVAWRVASDGSWVDPPGGERIDLHRHAANARIMAFLAKRRISDPGEPTDAEGLAAVGWPGERIVPAAAANRVRVALSTLRRKGLADIIERIEGGWRLAADQSVQIREV